MPWPLGSQPHPHNVVGNDVTGQVIAVVGPTAAGKSAVAIELAQHLGVEIINADSMQGYRGMDIGTAKPTRAQRDHIPHHVIDAWPHHRDISVVEFRDAARAAIDEVLAHGRTPVIVGGSWLYVQAIVDDFHFPPTDPTVRAAWEKRLETDGVAVLYAQLEKLDPAAAAAILPNNARRIVRALEVIELQGSFTATLPSPTPWRPAAWFGLDLSRPDLDARIRARVDAMWDAGFVDEVALLATDGFSRTAGKALGYAQILTMLAGECTEGEAKEMTVRATQRFARRQQRRFRQDERIHWLDAELLPAELAADIAQRTAT